MKLKKFLVVRMSDGKALTLDALDAVHALNVVALDQHGFVAAKNAEVTYGETHMFITGDGFRYAAKEL